jgi:hypothetical protein
MVRTSKDEIFMGRTWTRRRVYLRPEDFPGISFQGAPADNGVTGFWVSDQGLRYYIREVGEQLWWFCHRLDWAVSNVAMGTRVEPGRWKAIYNDLLLSTRFRFSGEIEVRAESNDRLAISNCRGPYACTVLMRHAVYSGALTGCQ